MTRSIVATPSRDVRPARRGTGDLCLLCGAALRRASAHGFGARGVCSGCADRLELELTGFEAAACPDCGRHQELCAVMPCSRVQPEVHQAIPLIKKLNRGQLSGAERIRAIERLAMTK